MSVLEAAIGWLAPPQCLNCGAEGDMLCKACSTSVIRSFGERCWQCAKLSSGSRTCESCRRLGSPGFVWITTIYESTARHLVRAYKFEHQRAAAESLADLMAETFMPAGHDYLIVPVATATKRVRQRSFDHAKLLARTVARKTRLESYNALARLGQASQIGASRSVRLAQPVDNYFVRSRSRVQGRSILLVDDVLTTGGTMCAAAKALRAAGAKHVDALIFAKRL